MRKVFLNLSFILLTVSLSAQITVTSSDFLRVLDDDIFGIVPTNSEILTLPAAGENMVWDYTNLEFDPNDMALYATTNSGTATTAPEANSTNNFFTTLENLPGLAIPSTGFQRLDDNGLVILGRHTEAVSYPIGAITGEATDSLNFLDKTHIYEPGPNPIVVMPVTYGDNEIYNFNWSLDLLLTATPFGLDRVPTEIAFYFTETRETLGWGVLKTKEPLTGNVIEVEVLLIKRTLVEVDSFFMGGQLAPTSITDAFGVTQGQSRTSYGYSFWTKGLKRTAFNVSVNPNGVITGNMSTDLGTITSTDKVVNNLLPVTVFPNPAKDAFTVEFAKESADTWTFELYNSIGQLTHQQAIEGYQSKAVISPNTKSVGLHCYSLKDENGVIVGSGKVLLE